MSPKNGSFEIVSEDVSSKSPPSTIVSPSRTRTVESTLRLAMIGKVALNR